MLTSIYPDDVIRRVLAELEALDVLEYLDYQPQSLLRDRGRIRMFCPVHGETVFRTLVVDEETREAWCTKRECPQAQRGDLIGLVARSRRVDYDTALRKLVEEFSLSVNLPENQEALNTALVEAENLAELARTDGARSADHHREALDRVERVLAEDPANLRALQVWRRLLLQKDPGGDLSEVTRRLCEAHLRAGNGDAFVALAEEHLDAHPDHLRIRRKLADYLMDEGLEDRALEQFMMLADTAEIAGDYQQAIDAYRAIEKMADAGMDVGPMISQLLVALDQSKEAARDLVDRAGRARERGDGREAEQLLEEALQLEPEGPEPALALLDLQLHRGITREETIATMRRIDAWMQDARRETAVEALDALAAAMPEDTVIVERLMACHKGLGDAEQAGRLQRRLVDMYLAEDDRLAARTILDDIITNNPEDTNALVRFARLAAEDEDIESALTHYRTAARIHERAGDMTEAADCYREMVGAAPDSARIAMEYVDLLLRLERRDDALEALRSTIAVMKEESNLPGLNEALSHALSLSPDEPEFLLDYAWALDRMDAPDQAIEQRLKACRAMIAAGRAAAAEEHLVLLLEKHPRLTAAKEVLADAYEAQGRRDRATEQLRELAAILSETRRASRARDVLEKLVDLDPLDLAALEQLLDVYAELDDEEALLMTRERLMALHRSKRRYDDAIREGELIVDREPQNLEVHRQLLELYRLNGDATQWGLNSRRMAKLLQQQGAQTEEREILQEILLQRPRDFEARERLITLLSESEPESRDAAEAVEAYVDLAEKEGAVERAAKFLSSLRGRTSTSALVSRRLVGLYEKAELTEEQEAELLDLLRRQEDAGDADETAQTLRELLKLKPADVDYHRRLVDLLLKAGKTHEAAEAALALADLHARHHRYDEAEEVYRQVLENEAANDAAWRGLSRMYAARGRADEAVEMLQELARLEAAEGNREAAFSALKDAFELVPESPAVQRAVVDLVIADGDQDRALEELEKLAAYYEKAGQEDAAFAARREAVELAPSEVRLRRKLVNTLIERGRRAQAADELVGIAELSREAGRHDEALDLLQECLDIEPEHLRARSVKAEVLEEKGEPEAALKEWRALAPLLEKQSRAVPQTPFSSEVGDGGAATPLMILREYDFDRFVVGEHNRFARATAMAVAKAPGRTPHNPLFLYSDVGLGKTHILHAVANHVHDNQPDLRIVYTNAEDFTSELIDAIQNNQLNTFRQKHKSSDLLLMDDVHFLAGKEVAQEEFFHIFNTLFQARKQIIVTSDRPPKDMAHLEKRLRSRFGSGVIIDIQQPNMETRVAILRRDAAERPELKVPEEVLTYLAEHIDSNIRELKAALNQLLLQHEIGGDALDLATAEAVVEKMGAEA